jgi:nuclear protein localization family protein 4
LIARVAVAHETGDHAALDEVVKTDAWKTLVTIARDQASSKSKSTLQAQGPPTDCCPGSRPTVSNDGFEEIPAHLLEEINGFSGSGAGDTGNAGSTAAAAEKECPHCTYVNAAGAQDCDVCGLPLN